MTTAYARTGDSDSAGHRQLLFLSYAAAADRLVTSILYHSRMLDSFNNTASQQQAWMLACLCQKSW